MTVWLDFMAWIGACVAVHHHAERLRAARPYTTAAAAAVAADYDAAHAVAAAGARAAGRSVRSHVVTARWLHEARMLHRRQCKCRSSDGRMA